MNRNYSPGLLSFLKHIPMKRSLLFGVLILAALLAFEVFNYSTTEFALTDLLGDLHTGPVRWATVLSIAFCGIDFAGIARLFTPEQGADEPKEIWYLFGAWLLAATMNAMLTWWGVSIAVLNHSTLGNAVVSQATLLKAVPVFVAVLVWLSRILIIGTFSTAGERLFGMAADARPRYQNNYARPNNQLPYPAAHTAQSAMKRPATPYQPRIPVNRNNPYQPATRQASSLPSEPVYSRQEPTYEPVMSASPRTNPPLTRQ